MLLSKKKALEQNGNAALTFSNVRTERDTTFSFGTECPPLSTRLAILAILIAMSDVATKYKYRLRVRYREIYPGQHFLISTVEHSAS